MRPTQPPDQELRSTLMRALGTADFDAAYSEGQRLSPTQALHVASSGQRDSSRPALA
jgi:hypothetical protein